MKTMRLCKRCFREFTEGENSYHDPATELTEIFLESAGQEISDLCPQCRQESGMSNLMGVGQ